MGQRSHSGGKSYGMTKRAAPEQVLGTGAKKVKVSLPPALVTKPHASTSGLSKPFKTPFKTPFIKLPPPPPPPCSPSIEPSRRSEVNPSDYDDVEIVDYNEASTTEVPDIVTDLDDAYSGKIPMDARLRGFNNIRRALYGLLILCGDETWSTFNAARMSVEDREKMICTAAKELELSCLLMCSTKEGYTERVEDTVDVIGSDVQPLLDAEERRETDAEDDAQADAVLLRRLCESHVKGARSDQ
ncbi:hypothetical protein C0991_003474 [Blastosporella zonata]|nr:hypothetical protein C0991_003474 [Blastosporella zonata]